MAKRVILPTDIPVVVADVNAKVTARQNDMTRQKFFQSKTFEELSAADKDRLLKFIAARLGLIQDSRDA